MKKFLKTFLAVNLSLFIALSLVVTPIPESQYPIQLLSNLTGQNKGTN